MHIIYILIFSLVSLQSQASTLKQNSDLDLGAKLANSGAWLDTKQNNISFADKLNFLPGKSLDQDNFTADQKKVKPSALRFRKNYLIRMNLTLLPLAWAGKALT